MLKMKSSAAAVFGISLVVLTCAAPGIHGHDYAGFREHRTEHFSFIYEPRDRDSVAELIGYADEVYELVTSFLDNRPADRIRVLVNGRTDLANGYFDPSPRHHIGLFVASPSGPLLGARTESWLRTLFIHELTHYVHLMYERGLRNPLSRVFGRPLLAVPGAFLPGWAIEGIAMEAETRFSGGGRGRNPYYEIYYAAHIIEEQMFDYARARYDSAGPPPGRFYVAGLLFVDYLLERFGDDAFTRIHQEFLRFPVLGFNRAIQSVTGHTPETLWEDMVAELEKRYAPRRSIASGTRYTPARVAHYHAPVVDRSAARAPGGSNGHPAGTVYTYRTAPDRRPAIVRISGDGEETVVEHTPLTDGDSFDVADNRIVFASIRTSREDPGPVRRHSVLYLREPDGGVRRISGASGLYHPRFAASLPTEAGRNDGDYVIAVQRRGQYHRLVWVDVSTGAVTPLYEPERSYLYTPAVSPDGGSLAFAEKSGGRQQIRTLALPDPGEPLTGTPHTPAPARSDQAQYQPAWQPDGTLLYISDAGGYLSARGGGLSARGGGRPARGGRRIGDDPVGVLSLAALPDGTFVYGSYRSSGYTIMRGLHRSEAGAADSPAAGETAGETSGGRRGGDIPRGGFPSGTPGDTLTPQASTSPEAPLPGERRFSDLPLPSLWLPYPSLVSSAQRPLDIGIGIATFGANYQRNATTTALAGYHPRIRQPVGNIELDMRRGRSRLLLEARQDYQAVTPANSQATVAQQRTTVSALAGLDLFARVERGRSVAAGPFATTTFQYVVEGTEERDFAFTTTPEEPLGQASRLQAGAGVYARYRGLNTRRDLYDIRRISAQARVERDVQGFGSPRPGFRTRLDTGTVLPLAEAGVGLTLEAGGAYTTGPPPATSPFTVRGVGRVTDTLGRAGRLRGVFGLHSTVALLDQPLPLGFNLQGLALAFFAETQGGFSPTEHLDIESQVWLRFEVLTALGYNIGVGNLTTGVTVPVRAEEIGNPGIYVSLGS